MCAMKDLLAPGQGRRLLIGAVGSLLVLSILLFLDSTLPRWAFNLFLAGFVALSLYLLGRGR
jgi:hypothetical protein